MGEADGQEVLVVDGDVEVQRGLAEMLKAAGLVPTVLGDTARARTLAKEKFFPVALIDLDTPEPRAGLELVRWLHAEAQTTTLFVMVARKVFEDAVEAFRAGAADVVVKSPNQVDRLRRSVVEAAATARRRTTDERLIGEVLGVHEDFLKRLMDASRRIAELEEQLGGAHPGDDNPVCQVAVVEPLEGDWLAGQLHELLRGRTGFGLRSAGSGSEGLDLAGRQRFQIALVCDQLPDLPGSMVVSGFKTQSPETITILYSRPGVKPGRAEIVEGARTIPLVQELSDVRQIVARIDELHEVARRTARERRYLASFRQENYELLRRYAELKRKLQRA